MSEHDTQAHEATIALTVIGDAARIFRGLTSSAEQAAIAGGAASFDPVVGGAVTWTGGRLGHVTATIDELDVDRRIALSVHALAWLDGWGLGPLATPSRVTIDLAPGDGPGRTLLTLRHVASSAEQARCLEREWRRFYLVSLQMHFERWAQAIGDGAAKLSISRFAAFRWGDATVSALSGAGGKHFDVPRDVALAMLNAFAKPRTRADAVAATKADDRAAFEAMVDAFIGAAILEASAAISGTGAIAAGAGAKEATQAARWEPHELLFHQVAAQFGNGAWHALGRTEAPPAIKPAMSTAIVKLSPATTLDEMTLRAALDRRCSIREFEQRPLPLDTLSTLLGASAQNAQGDSAWRWNQEWMPGKYVSRPYASGGARYSSELYVFLGANAIEGLDPGIYRYCPESHHLEQLATGSSVVDPVLAAVSSESMIRPPPDVAKENVVPPILIVVTSRFSRVTFKYGGVAYDLVLKETGALLQTLYLVTAALNLAGCALGAVPGAARTLARNCSVNPLEEPVVGYYMVGRPYGRALSGRTIEPR